MKKTKRGSKLSKQKKRPTPQRRPVAPAGDNTNSPAPVVPVGIVGALADAAPIDIDGVMNILAGSIRPLMPANEFRPRTIIADNRYLQVPPDFVRNAIVTDPILSAQNYHADIFDCDDYVQYLKTKMSLYATTNRLQSPLAVGYMLTTVHAFSYCIGPGSRLYLINTQSDTVLVTGDQATFRQFLSLRPDNQITCIYI